MERDSYFTMSDRVIHNLTHPKVKTVPLVLFTGFCICLLSLTVQCCCIVGISLAVGQYSNIKNVMPAPAYRSTHTYCITVMDLLSIPVEQKNIHIQIWKSTVAKL